MPVATFDARYVREPAGEGWAEFSWLIEMPLGAQDAFLNDHRARAERGGYDDPSCEGVACNSHEAYDRGIALSILQKPEILAREDRRGPSPTPMLGCIGYQRFLFAS